MALAHSPSITRTGLRLWLDAANTKSYPGSGTTWTDLTGNGFNGTLVNSPTFNSSNNGSLVFDGSTNYSTSGAVSGSFTSFTVQAWFYPTSVTNYRNVIDCNFNYNATTGNIGPRLEMNSSGNLNWLYSNITGDNNQYYVQNVVVSGLAANTWHHAAITYNGTTSTTYYNGQDTGLSRTLQGSPTGFVGVMNNVFVGKGFFLDSAATRSLAGRVGVVLLYNTALTANNIRNDYEALRGRYGI